MEARAILDLIHGFRASKTLFSAVELGVFDGYRETGRGFQRLLAACEALGLLEKRNLGYENTAAANRYLRKDSPHTLAGYIRYSNETLYALWSDLEGAVVDDASRWSRLFGTNAAQTRSAVFNSRDFALGMHGLGILSSSAVIACFDLSKFASFVDLGGGTGHLAAQALSRYPSMRVAVVDTPAVLTFAREHLPPEIELINADFCADALPPADLFALGRILHHRSDERALALLRKLHSELPLGGGVLLVESLLDNPDSATSKDAHMHSLNMLVCTDGGRERSSAEYVALLTAAGFVEPRVGITGAPMDAILATK